MARKLIGESMVEANLISQWQLEDLLQHQKKISSSMRVPIGRLSVELGLIREEQFIPFLASYFNTPYLNLEEYSVVQIQAVKAVPRYAAEKFNILPVDKQADVLTVAASDPLDLITIDNLALVTKCRIKFVLSSPRQIRDGIPLVYDIPERFIR